MRDANEKSIKEMICELERCVAEYLVEYGMSQFADIVNCDKNLSEIIDYAIKQKHSIRRNYVILKHQFPDKIKSFKEFKLYILSRSKYLKENSCHGKIKAMEIRIGQLLLENAVLNVQLKRVNDCYLSNGSNER